MAVLPFNKSMFKSVTTKSSGDKLRPAKAETLRFLYLVNPTAVIEIVKLHGIDIVDDNGFEKFYDLYKANMLPSAFNMDKVLNQIYVTPSQIKASGQAKPKAEEGWRRPVNMGEPMRP